MASSPNAGQEAVVDSITMLDVLNEEKEMEDETAAVLGGSDEKNCTYFKGPVKRQALYSCLTCVPEAKDDCQKSVGVCLACSYACHENHELVELYTKRNFTCDCGTPKMGAGKRCQLDEKTRDNTRNEYNQNYSGLYCNCHRPYPDPERPDDTDEMIQCIVCEDWYHSLHLDTEPSAAQDFCEMICGPCVQRLPFLKDYSGLCVTGVVNADESALLDVTANTTVNEEALKEEDEKKNEATPTKEGKADDDEEDGPGGKRQKLDDSSSTPSSSSKTPVPEEQKKCKRPTIPGPYEKGATFWPDNWRDQLCQCEACLTLYRELKVEYLVDQEDTVKWYESVGMKKLAANKESDYDRGMRQLSSLDRVRQIDAITAYNKMKDRLKDYLEQFAASQQVVTEADIKRFFAQIKNEDQKDLMVHSDIPFNCR